MRRTWRHIRSLILLLVPIAAFGLGVLNRTPARDAGNEHQDVMLTCSMHPQVRQSKGTCPICGMQLVPIGTSTPEAPLSPSGRRFPVTDDARAKARLRAMPVERLPQEVVQATLVGRVSERDDQSKLGPAGLRWLDLIAYEADAERVALGRSVLANADGMNEIFYGRIESIQEHFEHDTGSMLVRAMVRDRSDRLKPGMIVVARILGTDDKEKSPLGIPRHAPVFTARGPIVFVMERGTTLPTYEARLVKLGPKTADGWYPVLAGLTEGERVVMHGSFAVDADVQLRNEVAMLDTSDELDWASMDVYDPIAELTSRSQTPEDPYVTTPPQFTRHLGNLMQAYLELHEALAKDALPPAQQAAKALRAESQAIRPAADSDFARRWYPAAAHFELWSEEITDVKDLETARAAFRDISDRVLDLLRSVGNYADHPVQVVHCPMAFSNAGATWVQSAAELKNPYFGKSMLSCGTIQATVNRRGYLFSESVKSN